MRLRVTKPVRSWQGAESEAVLEQLTYFISDAVTLLLCLSIIAQVSAPYSSTAIPRDDNSGQENMAEFTEGLGSHRAAKADDDDDDDDDDGDKDRPTVLKIASFPSFFELANVAYNRTMIELCERCGVGERRSVRGVLQGCFRSLITNLNDVIFFDGTLDDKSFSTE
ncbi:hypothetical protein ANN_22243 [Periplaneta americana]|uniref:Uncharacterized protein n=1 Tax=Periplaneta americana TaxID=6978 RepID=A0ABQ8S8H5_PERAM|nr:hypothetical protein ANN_22243 [Periplaneta americana]